MKVKKKKHDVYYSHFTVLTKRINDKQSLFSEKGLL